MLSARSVVICSRVILAFFREKVMSKDGVTAYYLVDTMRYWLRTTALEIYLPTGSSANIPEPHRRKLRLPYISFLVMLYSWYY